MSGVLMGAVALGLLWAMVTLGVYISYRVLDIADLSVEGSIVLGASVASVMIAAGHSPLLASVCAMLAGAAAGLATGFLHTKLKIPALLSGILCMIALYSINIRVMGGTSNITLLRKTVFLTPLMNAGLEKNAATILCALIVLGLVVAALRWFLGTQLGFALRATGSNAAMARAQGINTHTTRILGLALANALVGLAGGLIAQYQGFADVQMGQGAIVIGLASLIIGEVLLGKEGILRALVAVSVGAVLYRIIIALVIEAGMPATDLKLFTAITVAAALYLPHARKKISGAAHAAKHRGEEPQKWKEGKRHAGNRKREQNI